MPAYLLFSPRPSAFSALQSRKLMRGVVLPVILFALAA
jgi:hypothetical protein